MSLEFYTPPEIEEIIARCKTYVKSELKELNPTDQNNLIYSLIVALSNLSNDINKEIQLDILPNVFPQYCKNETSLSTFSEIKNVPRTPATSSSGVITIQGNILSIIPLGTVLIANNKQYKTQNTVEINNQSINLNSLSVNGTLVTAKTSSTHNFASNNIVTISGAKEEKLNGDFVISVNGLDSFTYNISETLTVKETDGLTASANIAVMNIKCLETGADTNLKNGDSLSLETPIEGVNSNAYVQYSGVSGGSDLQEFNDWKNNVVFRYQNPITYFNVNNIKKVALSVSGVTKVWVYPTTPKVGQVTVYFIRGNDEDVIPDANEVNEVSQKIKELRNVKDDPADVFVYAPNPKVVNFTFNSITPNTPTMKDAIKNSLKQLFEDSVELGVSLKQKDYNNAIGNSYDMETGNKLKDYTLSTPSEDITVQSGELPILGDVTFL